MKCFNDIAPTKSTQLFLLGEYESLSITEAESNVKFFRALLVVKIQRFWLCTAFDLGNNM